MTLGERIDLAREALAQGLALLPIVLSALEIPRATWSAKWTGRGSVAYFVG